MSSSEEYESDSMSGSDEDTDYSDTDSDTSDSVDQSNDEFDTNLILSNGILQLQDTLRVKNEEIKALKEKYEHLLASTVENKPAAQPKSFYFILYGVSALAVIALSVSSILKH